MLQKLFLIGLAGAAGTLVRYWLSGFVQRSVSWDFPIGITVVNAAGCLLFGIIWAIVESKLSISSQMRVVIFIGFFGGFTSLSAFLFDSCQFMDDSQWLLAAGHVILNNIVGLGAMLTGFSVGRLV